MDFSGLDCLSREEPSPKKGVQGHWGTEFLALSSGFLFGLPPPPVSESHEDMGVDNYLDLDFGLKQPVGQESQGALSHPCEQITFGSQSKPVVEMVDPQKYASRYTKADICTDLWQGDCP